MDLLKYIPESGVWVAKIIGGASPIFCITPISGYSHYKIKIKGFCM